MKKTRHLVMVIAVVAIVLGIGAVSAYAALVDDVTAPVTTSDAVATYWNGAVVHLTATDASGSGVAYIYKELDHGVVRLFRVGAGAAETDAPDAQYRPLAPGSHTIRFWAQDKAGNVETSRTVTFTVAEDLAAPVTTASGATDGSWYKESVTVDLTADDQDGKSGVKQLSYALGAATPTIVAAATAEVGIAIDAATANGPLVLAYHATDVAGNVEVAKTLTINVDTKKPTTSAPAAASVVKGRTATLKFKVTDAAPNAGAAKVVIKVRTRSGKLVKTIKAGSVAVNKTLSAKFRCRLAKGTYAFSVYATDVAGNVQAKIGSNKLTVK